MLLPALGPQHGKDVGLMDTGSRGYPEDWVTSAAKGVEIVHPGEGTREMLLWPFSILEGIIKWKETFYRPIVTTVCATV